jgi:hypothetical protein
MTYTRKRLTKKRRNTRNKRRDRKRSDRKRSVKKQNGGFGIHTMDIKIPFFNISLTRQTGSTRDGIEQECFGFNGKKYICRDKPK